MSLLGVKVPLHVILAPKGAANYDITGATAGVTDMETALTATSLLFGCGATYPLIGNVTVKQDVGDKNPCGRTEKLYKLIMTVAGLDTVADNAVRTALLALDGIKVNVYAYDKTSAGAGIVYQGLGWVVKVIDPDESGSVDSITVEVTERYFGSTTSQPLVHTYTA